MELPVALTTQAFDRLASFYRVGLGMEPSQVWPAGQGRALVLDMGRARAGGVLSLLAVCADDSVCAAGEVALTGPRLEPRNACLWGR